MMQILEDTRYELIFKSDQLTKTTHETLVLINDLRGAGPLIGLQYSSPNF